MCIKNYNIMKFWIQIQQHFISFGKQIIFCSIQEFLISLDKKKKNYLSKIWLKIVINNIKGTFSHWSYTHDKGIDVGLILGKNCLLLTFFYSATPLVRSMSVFWIRLILYSTITIGLTNNSSGMRFSVLAHLVRSLIS